MKFIGKKANFPPLGLLTAAAMLPSEWEKRLVDMNVTHLNDEDIKWADLVFISAMVVQKESAKEVIDRCHQFNIQVAAGGPLFTTEPEQFRMVEYLVLNEAEITLPLFLSDLAKQKPQRIYTTTEHPDIAKTPIPSWSLIDMSKYWSMSLQYSRGCPFNCEFCEIGSLDGHDPRTKDREQILSELDSLYNNRWRGHIFIVDDNFIGNKNKLKSQILPALIEWQTKRNYPFALFTEVSINLADDEELMQLMVKAGFGKVFIGIETPNEASLTESNKKQNTGRDLMNSVKILQNHGFEVFGGFIMGFDNDPVSIFDTQIKFIQESGVVAAMVDLLNAPRGSPLYQRLKQENRLVDYNSTGNYMDSSMNFIPKMNRAILVAGYEYVLNTIYSPRNYYERIKTLLKEYKPKVKVGPSQIQWHLILGLLNSMWFLGVLDKGRRYYWQLFASTLLTNMHSFSVAITCAIYGYHFRKILRIET